jgi:organic radical activating enzyme
MHLLRAVRLACQTQFASAAVIQGVEGDPSYSFASFSLQDRKGQALIDGVLEVVGRLKPLHLSLAGGDPLVRYREVEALVPMLIARGVYVQVVTSAFRPLAAEWGTIKGLS